MVRSTIAFRLDGVCERVVDPVVRVRLVVVDGGDPVGERVAVVDSRVDGVVVVVAVVAAVVVGVVAVVVVVGVVVSVSVPSAVSGPDGPSPPRQPASSDPASVPAPASSRRRFISERKSSGRKALVAVERSRRGAERSTPRRPEYRHDPAERLSRFDGPPLVRVFDDGVEQHREGRDRL